MRVLLGIIALVLLVTPAMADKATYCQAYARDFSDQRASDKETWQHKFQIALDSCLASHKQTPGKSVAVVHPPDPAKPVVQATAVQPAKSTPIKAKATNKPADSVQSAAVRTKPVPGTQAWNDYCAKKYTSFNVKTGMYLSHTGVERRCVFTVGPKA